MIRYYLIGLFFLCCIGALNAQETHDTLTVGYSSAAPFIINDEGAILIGVNVWLWEQIAKDLNLKYRFREMDFQAMLQELESENIDISINPLTMTADRSRKFGFTSPYYVSNATIVMECSSRWDTAIRVLQTVFSRAFLEAFVLLLFIVAFFGWLLWIFEKKHNTEHFRPGFLGVWDGFWWSSVTMTTVGYGDKKIKSLGGKIIALIWMFTALLFISGLTASIASTIMKDSSLDRVQALNSLTNSRVGTLEGTSMENYLRRQFFKKVTNFSSIESGLIAIENQEIVAFIYDEPILKYRVKDRSIDNLEIMPVRFDQQLYAFGISNNHKDLEELISERILYYTSTLEWKALLVEYNINTDYE